MRDVAIIGAGPVGLCLASTLAASGMKVSLIERQPRSELAQPAPDGREIALTHASRRLLCDMNIWQHLNSSDISPLRQARVFNGQSTWFMGFGDPSSDEQPLGFMVPNHAIRHAAHEAAATWDNIKWHHAGLASIASSAHCATLDLDNGERLHARLAVAADSRFSTSRRQMGIAAEMRDNGRSMMVCRVSHEHAHDQSAWEWFDYGQTLALLPISPHLSSAVVTLPHQQMEALMALDSEAFSAQLTQRYGGRLGRMSLIDQAYAYPLISTYAERFHAQRFALVGDAAVGMHPVTAHGFNFGVHSTHRLARRVIKAFQRGQDIAAPRLLSAYEREHRLATRPLYLATQAIVSLYTDERRPARLLRHLGLQLGERMEPARALISRHLQGEALMPGLTDLPPLPALPRLPFMNQTS
ncbi:5-demethoxyubiquinol-8 5-hydroxylase UbiM [Halomonas binhaiensis]|uniref:5-demethoxyubiquinol-8 5-hydroxylase UbiM n=1 Tax=Halomonas binhaiensis TaxID=2562282 RepID=A0A5C1NGT0_9GAMM|nr:5-demethoxyubiquinol-8 5-hydroxylase UbiM [Halomonas binhaiensis]QEM81863.1 5-demethoxyubiquinol-8 5-hydroxylase UbiM [Halomonas binhaiensis]